MVRGSYSFVLAWKLKELKKDLKVWNKEVFVSILARKEKAQKWIGFYDQREREYVLGIEEGEIKRCVMEENNKCTLMEEISWRQKSWLYG